MGVYIGKKEAQDIARIQPKEGGKKSFEKQRVVPQLPLKEEMEQPQEKEVPTVSDVEIVRSAETKDIFIETDLYKIVITNEGASFKNLKLKKYLNKKKELLEIVDQIQDSIRPPYLSTFDTRTMEIT